MSPARPEQVTIQIRSVLDRAWEFVALAYKGRAYVALGFPSWDDYIDARFGDLRVTVPREHRAEVVNQMASARMSIRAIAKLLGIGVGTVHRELTRANRTRTETVDAPEVAYRPSWAATARPTHARHLSQRHSAIPAVRPSTTAARTAHGRCTPKAVDRIRANQTPKRSAAATVNQI